MTTLYRALLRTLPADLRREFGDEMARLFDDERRALGRRPWRVLVLWISAMSDVLLQAIDARRPQTRRTTSRGEFMRSWWQDVNYGARLFRRQPGFTALAIAVLALGIGANSAVFTIVNGLLFKPRMGSPAGDLAQLFSRDTTNPDTYRAFSYPNYLDLRSRTDVFASLSAHMMSLAGVDHGDGVGIRQRLVDVVTSNYFDTFGVRLVRGRVFTADEERPGANRPVAILSDATWRLLGGGEVIGHTIRVNGRPFTVIGIAPPGFGGSMAVIAPDLWLPLGVYETVVNDFVVEGLSGSLDSRAHHSLVIVAQLRPGATIRSVTPALDAIGHAMAAAYPSENKGQELMLAPLSRLSLTTSPRHEGPLTAFAVSLVVLSGLVLVIACLNVANMLLARGASRRRELAIRTAIGGGRWRIARQLLVEGSLLAGAGAVAGLALAYWSTETLVAALAGFSPVTIAFDAAPDARVLTATIVCTCLATIFFGLGPALGLARANAVSGLRDRAGDIGSGRRRLRLQHVLVMGQLALSLVMLTVSGLFVRGALQATRVDPGFTLDRGILIHADSRLSTIDRSAMPATYARVLDTLRARPDVVAAGAASSVPFGDIEENAFVQKAGAPLPEHDPSLIDSSFTVVTSGYFDALGLRVLAGRDFMKRDDQAAAGEAVAILDQPLASKIFGTTDPIGRQVQYHVHAAQAPVTLRVVGVVPGLREEAFDLQPVPHLYVPFGQNTRTELFVHVRTRTSSIDAETAMLAPIRQSIANAAPDLPLLSVETRPMFRRRNLQFSMLNLGSAMFLVFGGVALILATAGVYGVKSYVVSNRTREIGIRVALGATSRGVVWTIVREGLVLSASGVGIGVLLSIVATTSMSAITFSDSGIDVATVAIAIAILAVSATLASWIPARRATRIQPTQALRAE